MISLTLFKVLFSLMFESKQFGNEQMWKLCITQARGNSKLDQSGSGENVGKW